MKIEIEKLTKSKPNGLLVCTEADKKGKQFELVTLDCGNPAFVATQIMGLKPKATIKNEDGNTLAHANKPIPYEDAMEIAMYGPKSFEVVSKKPDLSEIELWREENERLSLMLYDDWEGFIEEEEDGFIATVNASKLEETDYGFEPRELVVWQREYQPDTPVDLIKKVVFRKCVEFINASETE